MSQVRSCNRFAFAIALTAASLAHAAAHVKDGAQMFSAQAAQAAESQLDDLQRRNGKNVIVETMSEPPADVQQKIVADATQRNAVLFQLAGQRRQAANADVYVLLNKTPGNFQLTERRELQSTGLPAADRTQIQDAMLNAFKQKHFDEGLATGVTMLVRSLGDATLGSTSNVPPSQQPRRTDPTTPTAPPVVTPAPASRSGGLLGGGCCTIVGIGLLAVIVLMIVRRFTNRGPGQGFPPTMQQGGYPPQYPQQPQGGGFGRGMTGGLLGGVLGSVLGNQISRGHDGGGGGGHTPADPGAVGGGGDFGSSDAGSQDTGSVGGGGDFGGGGDSGGGGGGGGDAGGGGDF